MFYSEQEISTAILSAKHTINERTRRGKYIRGYNDCWMLIVVYENFLRGPKTLAYKLPNCDTYKDHFEFFKIMHEEGFSSIQELAKVMKFEIVDDMRPQFGDVAYEEGHGVSTAMIADRDYWIAPTEDAKGIENRRRVLPKEIRPALLVRPTYL